MLSHAKTVKKRTWQFRKTIPGWYISCMHYDYTFDIVYRDEYIENLIETPIRGGCVILIHCVSFNLVYLNFQRYVSQY